MLHIPGLYMATSEEKGRGVFTAVDLEPGDIIESCPLIIIPSDQKHLIDASILHDYYFNWPQPPGAICLPLGYGALYNHSFQPNAEIVLDLENQQLEFHCIRPIQAGTEILIDYSGGDAEAGKKLWFKVLS